MARTQEEIRVLNNQLGEETGIRLGWDKIGDRPESELRARIAAILAKRNKRAGVKALVAKYGPASASRIVLRESGRTIRETPRQRF